MPWPEAQDRPARSGRPARPRLEATRAAGWLVLGLHGDWTTRSIGPENRRKIGNILGNFETLSEALGSQGPVIEAAVQDTAETMAKLNSASGALEAMAVALRDDSQRLVDHASAAMLSIEDLAGGVQGTVAAGQEDLSKLVEDLDGTARAFTAKMIEMPRRGIIAWRSFERTIPASADRLDDVTVAFDQALGKVLRDLVEWTIAAGTIAFDRR